jgi:hypothetical protein
MRSSEPRNGSRVLIIRAKNLIMEAGVAFASWRGMLCLETRAFQRPWPDALRDRRLRGNRCGRSFRTSAGAPSTGLVPFQWCVRRDDDASRHDDDTAMGDKTHVSYLLSGRKWRESGRIRQTNAFIFAYLC